MYRYATPLLLGLSAVFSTGSALAQNVNPSKPSAQPQAVLHAIVFTDGESAPANAIRSGIDLQKVPALDTLEFKAQLNARLEKPLTPEVVREILVITNARLAAAGEDFSVAALPGQDATAGILRIKVIRARVGEVRVANLGAPAAEGERHRAMLRVKPGDLLVRETLDEDVEWIGRSNPYRSANVITQPGKNVGETDLDVIVSNRRPYGFSVAYDNNGTRITGRDRVTLSAGWGDVFGLDHQLSYTLNTNQQYDRYNSHSLNYVIPLPWRHLLSFSANYAQINPDLPAPFDQNGKSHGFSARYDVPLKTRGAFSHGVNLGLDYKRSDNNLLFSQVPVLNSLTEIYQWNLGYTASLRDAYGQTSAGLNWFYSPGDAGNRNTKTAFNASRAGATANYSYQTLSIERTTLLPANWAWVINARFQNANSNLLGSEQLSGGGVHSVRGFAEAIAFGDEGHVIRTEVRSPVRQLGEGQSSVGLQGLVFYDNARLRNKRLLPGEASRQRLSSWGAGLRASLPYDISLRVDAAKQLTADVQPGVNKAHLVHVSLSAAF